MLVVLPQISVFSKIKNKRTTNKNRNNKNQLYNRGNADFSARCTTGHYQNIENESQNGNR